VNMLGSTLRAWGIFWEPNGNFDGNTVVTLWEQNKKTKPGLIGTPIVNWGSYCEQYKRTVTILKP